MDFRSKRYLYIKTNITFAFAKLRYCRHIDEHVIKAHFTFKQRPITKARTFSRRRCASCFWSHNEPLRRYCQIAIDTSCKNIRSYFCVISNQVKLISLTFIGAQRISTAAFK